MLRNTIMVVGTFNQSTSDILSQYESEDLELQQVAGISPGQALGHMQTPNIVMILITGGCYERIKTVIAGKTGESKFYVYESDDALKVYLMQKWGSPEDIKSPLVKSSMIASVESPELPNDITEQLEDKDSQISELNKQLAQARLTIDELTRQTEENESNEEGFVNRIKSITSDLEAKRDEVADLEQRLKDAQAEITSLKETPTNTVDASELANAQLEITRLKDELQAEKEANATLSNSTENSGTELFEANSRITVLEGEKESAEKERDECIKEVGTLKEDLALKDNEISDLQGQITELNTKIIEASQNNEAQQQLEIAKTNLENKELDLQQKDSELSKLKEENGKLKAENEDLSTKGIELEAVKDELESLRGQLTDYERIKGVEQDLITVKDEKTGLEAKVKSLEGERDSLASQLAQSQTEVTKLENNLSLTKGQLDDVTVAKDEAVKSLEQATADVKELKKAKISLETKLETANRLADSKNTLALENENNRLKGIVNGLNDEVDRLKRDFSTKAVPRLFKDMSVASGYPKGANSLKCDLNLDLPASKLVVVADGSYESAVVSADLIERTCRFSNERIIVLDVAVDTRVDAKLKASQTSSLEWLTGNDVLQKAINKTGKKNVMYVGLTSSYCNEVSLLSIDWNAKLLELCNVADRVIIHVGSISSQVPRILFNTIKDYCKGYVVLSAAPTSVRTCLLTLWGIEGIAPDNVTVMYDSEAVLSSYTSGLLQKLQERTTVVKAQASTVIEF